MEVLTYLRFRHYSRSKRLLLYLKIKCNVEANTTAHVLTGTVKTSCRVYENRKLNTICDVILARAKWITCTVLYIKYKCNRQASDFLLNSWCSYPVSSPFQLEFWRMKFLKSVISSRMSNRVYNTFWTFRYILCEFSLFNWVDINSHWKAASYWALTNNHGSR